MTPVPKLHVVEAPAPKRYDVDAIVYNVSALLAGVILGAFVVTWQQRNAPPATCARVLEDGRHLMANDLSADGRESRCIYETPHPQKPNRRK